MSQLEQTKKEHTFYLNMGPQHPSTHGVLRVLLEMDGEHCLENEPVLGYGHRMQEKMGESRTWAGFMPNTARMDYLSALIYNHGYVGLVERMLGIECPRRAEFIRVITDELNRVQSHLLWLGAYLLDLGAFTPIMYTFDDREQILDILEDVTGSRLTYSYHRVGGVARDIDDKFIDATRAFIKRLRSRFVIYEELVNGNIIFLKRVKDIAYFTADMAKRYGLTGPCLRGAGIPYDIRKAEPYSIYPELDFEIPVGEKGDCLDAYMVRFKEMEQSLRIIEQCLDKLPEGPSRVKVPRRAKIPQGDASYSVETGHGELAYYMVSDGTDVPYRLKIRVPSFSNLSLLPELCRGMLLADLAMTMGTLDLVIPEIDR
ncbi:NADH-quinone oxidoreductase subunit D [Geomonas sp. RF6]|uniref:NADH-quinone oxidoreductase subunit D n=1 Tax=Geomonas sp. RF6 TaxID=2897342 RepID=UPI001E4D61DF|nr:NADH-quinone oxidoreductase subunit D [Geomonas sp. RF6]UFS69798.1 NADH-quinone oxidoreductase subunit D [Geomonas sp. RF6]